MINGATTVIEGVPGKHLDPLLLARSQAEGSAGFIVIAYELQPIGDDSQPSRFYDLLFFRGPEIHECARMNQDLRFHIRIEDASRTFKMHGREENTRVYLFTAPDEAVDRFRSTFYYEPCLKVHLDALSKKQIMRLLRATSCQRGIIEWNDFTRSAPLLHLRDIAAPEDISQYRPEFKHGRLLLYDVEKNNELVQQRPPFRSEQTVHPTSNSNDADALALTKPVRTSIRITNSPGDQQTHQLEPSVDEKEAEEFTQFIKQILNSAVPSDVSLKQSQKEPDQAFVITRKEEIVEQPHQDRTREREGVVRPRKNIPRRESKTKQPSSGQNKPQLLHNEGAGSVADSAATVKEDRSTDSPDYVRFFERLFRSFRQQLFDCLGDKCEAALADAERRVQLLTPEFDSRALNDETAVVTLDLIETVTNEASFLKRTRLRQAALTLVADLYNKHYELLEQHRVIDKVEQFYYRLKR